MTLPRTLALHACGIIAGGLLLSHDPGNAALWAIAAARRATP